MPEKVRRVRKKRSVLKETDFKNTLLSDSQYQQPKDPNSQDINETPKRTKRKKRRTTQKNKEEAKRTQKKSLLFSFIILGVIATIFAISILRFLHLNGQEYDQTFLNEVEQQYAVDAEIKGLSIFPKSINAGALKLKHKEKTFLFKEIELNVVKASHNSHGLVGLDWKSSSLEAESGTGILNLAFLSTRNENSNALFIDFTSYSIADFTLNTQHHSALIENTEFAISQNNHASLEGGNLNLPLLSKGITLNNIYLDQDGRIEGEINKADTVIGLKGFLKEKKLEFELEKVSANTSEFNEAQKRLLGDEVELNTYLYRASEEDVTITAQVKQKVDSVPFDLEKKILNYIEINENIKDITFSAQVKIQLKENEFTELSLNSLEVKSLNGYSYHIDNLENQQSLTGFVKFEPYLEKRLINFSVFYSLLEKKNDGLYLPLILRYDNGSFFDNLDILLFKKAMNTKLKTKEALEAELNSLLE